MASPVAGRSLLRRHAFDIGPPSIGLETPLGRDPGDFITGDEQLAREAPFQGGRRPIGSPGNISGGFGAWRTREGFAGGLEGGQLRLECLGHCRIDEGDSLEKADGVRDAQRCGDPRRKIRRPAAITELGLRDTDFRSQTLEQDSPWLSHQNFLRHPSSRRSRRQVYWGRDQDGLSHLRGHEERRNRGWVIRPARAGSLRIGLPAGRLKLREVAGDA